MKKFPNGKPDLFSVAATVTRSARGLSLHYVLKGPIDTLGLETSGCSKGAQDELWKRTCFEVFLGLPGSPAYAEWNFAPGGHYQSYLFEGPRKELVRGASLGWSPLSLVSRRRGPSEFALDAEVGFSQAPHLEWALSLGAKIDLQLSAVLWDPATAETTYFALDHKKAQADFHDRSAFLRF